MRHQRQMAQIARGYMIDKCEFNGINEYIIILEDRRCRERSKTNFAATIGSAMDEPVAARLDYRGSDERPIPVARANLRAQREACGASFPYCLLPRSVSLRIFRPTDLRSEQCPIPN